MEHFILLLGRIWLATGFCQSQVHCEDVIFLLSNRVVFLLDYQLLLSNLLVFLLVENFEMFQLFFVGLDETRVIVSFAFGEVTDFFVQNLSWKIR